MLQTLDLQQGFVNLFVQFGFSVTTANYFWLPFPIYNSFHVLIFTTSTHLFLWRTNSRNKFGTYSRNKFPDKFPEQIPEQIPDQKKIVEPCPQVA